MFKRLKVWGGGALAFLVLVALAVRYADLNTVSAAQLERQVIIGDAVRSDPVVMTMISLSGAMVQPGRFRRDLRFGRSEITPFEADDDWIQNLAIHLLNRTNRVVVCAEITVLFPETATSSTPAMRSVVLRLGRIPDNASFYSTGGRAIPQRPDQRPLSFAPGQTMTVGLGDHIGELAAAAGSGLPLTTATKLWVDPTTCYFRGGMKFMAGGYSEPDPANPGNWLHLDRNFFPGDDGANWPDSRGWVEGRP